MKKLLLLVVALSALFSCRKPQGKVINDDWTGYRKAYQFLNTNRDSAFYYFNKVATGVKDSLQISMAYTNMAIIQLGAGDYFGSQESFLQSLNYLDKGESKNFAALAGTYNELGTLSITLKNYNEAIGFLNRASAFKPDTALSQTILNNKATAYQRKGDYLKALAIYQKLMPVLNKEGEEYARVLTNAAHTQWLLDKSYQPLPQLLHALKIRQQIKDIWGESSSYFHISEYYNALNRDALAYQYAQLMYEKAIALNNPDEKLEALQQCIKTVPLNLTRSYFDRYEKLNDSLQTVRASAKNQFALIRYNIERHKAENLRLQKDNAAKVFQITTQRIILIGVVIVVVIVIFATTFWYRKKLEHQKLEAENRIKEDKLKISKRIHDVVANGLYQVMTKIEHGVHRDEEELLDEIEYLYDQSRDISYDKPPTAAEPFHQQIDSLLKSFISEDVDVCIEGNNAQLWADAGPQLRTDVRMILQELLVNMKKHSGATQVVLRFAESNTQLNINYEDNGKGLPSDFHYGNGLTNTGNRINTAGGDINFANREPKGLLINLSIPII